MAQLNSLLTEAVKYIKGDFHIEILTRDENMVVVSRKVITDCFVVPNYDNNGLKIKIEQTDFDNAIIINNQER